MKTYICLFLLLFTTIVLSQEKAEIQLPELAEELLDMKEKEQKMRVKYGKMIRTNKTETKKFKSLVEELINTDRLHTARMEEIVQQYGWPTYELVGRSASNAAWLLVQHADRNPLFQAECLPLLKEGVDNDQASAYCYAYLYDRVSVAFGRKQLYATQSSTNNGLLKGEFYPLEDESNVQIRREEMGIEDHVSDYASSMGFTYSIPSKEQAEIKALKLKERYETNLKSAQLAMNHEEHTKAVEYYYNVLDCKGHVTADDYYQTAKLLSLSNHENRKDGTFFLLRAAILGHPEVDSFLTNPLFQSLKEANPTNWVDLEHTIASLQ